MAKLNVEFSEESNGTFGMEGTVIEMFALLTFTLWKISENVGVPYDDIVGTFTKMLARCDSSFLENSEDEEE